MIVFRLKKNGRQFALLPIIEGLTKLVKLQRKMSIITSMSDL